MLICSDIMSGEDCSSFHFTFQDVCFKRIDLRGRSHDFASKWLHGRIRQKNSIKRGQDILT